MDEIKIGTIIKITNPGNFLAAHKGEKFIVESFDSKLSTFTATREDGSFSLWFYKELLGEQYEILHEEEINKKDSEQSPQKRIDVHYDFFYDLTTDETNLRQLKIDPYFVAKQWRLGERDHSGVLFHIFKTIARFGDKNPKEREIKAIYLQIKRLAELEGVELK